MSKDELLKAFLASRETHAKIVAEARCGYVDQAKMVQMHQDDHIVLEPSEFRWLVMDEWDWTSSFIDSTRGYSGLANEYTNTKGLD